MRLDKGPINLLWGVNVSGPEENMQGAVSSACKKQGALGGHGSGMDGMAGSYIQWKTILAINILAQQ